MIVFNLSSRPSLRSSRGNNSKLGGASDRKVKIRRDSLDGNLDRKHPLDWNGQKMEYLVPEEHQGNLEAKHGELPILAL